MSILSKNVSIKICRTFSNINFCIITLFRILYSLTEEWIFYEGIIKWILWPRLGKKNPSSDRLGEKKSCATRE